MKEVGETSVPTIDMEQITQFSTFYQNHGFVLPSIWTKHPSAHHLFGSETAVSGSSVEFQKEVTCHCVEGSNTTIILHRTSGQTVSLLTTEGWKLTRSFGRGTYQEGEHEDHGSTLKHRMVEQTAKFFTTIEKHRQHGERQEHVSHVSKPRAQRIIVDGKYARLSVVAIRGLVEAIHILCQDAIH